MFVPSRAVVSVSPLSWWVGLVLLGAVGCMESPPVPLPSDAGSTAEGSLLAASDGGTFPPKPTCADGGTSCPGACADGGSACLEGCGFLPPVHLAVGGELTGMAVGDLRDTGWEDLVVSDFQGNALAVLINQQGRFLTPSLWRSRRPMGVTLARLDGNETLDVLALRDHGTSLGVHRGRGDGTLGALVTTPSEPFILRAPVAWEHEGQRQVAVTRSASDEVAVFTLGEDGSVSNRVLYPSSREPWALAAEDFDGDGRTDLAISHVSTCSGSDNTCESVDVLLDRREGGFKAPQRTYVSGRAEVLLAARLDADYSVDLLVTDSSRQQILVLGGRGDGTFSPRQTHSTGPFVATAPVATALALLDINQDGMPDLVMGAQDGQVNVRLGRLVGTFGELVPLTPGPSGSSGGAVRALGTADFDRDGVPDLAVLTGSGVNLYWGICPSSGDRSRASGGPATDESP